MGEQGLRGGALWVIICLCAQVSCAPLGDDGVDPQDSSDATGDDAPVVDAGDDTQADADAPSTDAGSTCAVIEGDLLIHSPADMASVPDDDCLEVRGSVTIDGTTLSNLEGLEGVREVGERVVISNNPELVSLTGLGGLERFGRGLSIYGNDSLEVIDGLESLEGRPGRIESALYIEDNPVLKSLPGLSQITDAILVLENNDSLTDLSGLRSLERSRFMRIVDNDALVDLSGLERLSSVFGACGSVAGGGVTIDDNDSLESLDGLENLEVVNLGFSLANNPALVDITALEALQTTGRCHYGAGFSVVNNDALVSLEGFNIASPHTVIVEDNDALADLEALSVVTDAFVLTVQNNDALTSLKGLRNLGEVGFSWSVGARSVMGGLRIIANDSLVTLDGLQALGSADEHRGEVYIEQNERLESVRALFGAESFGALSVTRNPVLPSCQVDRLVAAVGADNIESLTICCNDEDATCS
jgi:hypothetical protein